MGIDQIFLESPLLQEMFANARALAQYEMILSFLARRFGPVPQEIGAAMRTFTEKASLHNLLHEAVTCPDLEAFRARMTGHQVLMESPLFREMMARNTAQAQQRDILKFLAGRFGRSSEEVADAVKTIYEEAVLDELVKEVASCTNWRAFRETLRELTRSASDCRESQ